MYRIYSTYVKYLRPQVAWTFFSGAYAPGAVTAAANWGTLPLVFGLLAFVYAGHGVFPSISASMQQPKQFSKARALQYYVLDKTFIIKRITFSVFLL